MEIIHQPITFTTLLSKMIGNIKSIQTYNKLKSDLIQINTVEEQEEVN
jgi:hypothetical protein